MSSPSLTGTFTAHEGNIVNSRYISLFADYLMVLRPAPLLEPCVLVGKRTFLRCYWKNRLQCYQVNELLWCGSQWWKLYLKLEVYRRKVCRRAFYQVLRRIKTQNDMDWKCWNYEKHPSACIRIPCMAIKIQISGHCPLIFWFSGSGTPERAFQTSSQVMLLLTIWRWHSDVRDTLVLGSLLS